MVPSLIPLKEMCSIFALETVKSTSVLRLHRRLIKMVPAAKRAIRKPSLQTSNDLSLPCNESTDTLVARILISLGITNYKVLSECEALARALLNSSVSAEVSPPLSTACIAATSVLLVCQRDKLKVSATRIANVSNVPEQDIEQMLQGENSPLKSICNDVDPCQLSPALMEDEGARLTPPRKQVRFSAQPTTSYIQ
eukprot:c7574_g1_i2.p1 GENE.c7574_g1_i2~~c7574_g1_i2.p1  ORF type:complete len:196 (-),score=35.16 c7574_g1_i2:352-939(-)